MNRMPSSNTSSNLFITTELNQGTRFQRKQFVNNRESNSWIVRNVLLRGENLLPHSQSEERSTCAPAHRESEPIGGIAHPLKGSPLVGR